MLDHSREIEYNKLSVSAQGDVSAMLHTPLRQAKPWRFDFEGVCEEAFETTNGQCVPYQLSKQFVRKGKAMFTQEELMTRLAIIAQRIYAESNNPYLTADQNGQPLLLECSDVGFTTAIVVEIRRELQCPIHVVWSNCKIECDASKA